MIRRLAAVVAGAAIAGFAFATCKLLIYRLGFGSGDWNRSISALVTDGIVLSVIYGLVLVVAAITPFWRWIEISCFSEWYRGPLMGACLTLVVWVAVITSGRDGWASADQTLAILVAAMALSNAVGGMLIWRLLKRRPAG